MVCVRRACSRGVVCRRGSRPWEESWNTLFLCSASNRKKDCWKWLWGRDFTPWMGMSSFPQPRNCCFICLKMPGAVKSREFFLFAHHRVLQPCWAGRLCLSYYPGSQSRNVWKSGIGRYRPPSETLWWPPLSTRTVTLGWWLITWSVAQRQRWVCAGSGTGAQKSVPSLGLCPIGWNNPPTLIAPEQILVETKVAFTYGAHPKTESQVIPWPLLERKIQEPESVAVGECGLDRTSQNPLGRQTDIFTRQMKMAAKYRKPLVLHLRNGKNLKLDVFETALQMAQKVLPCKQKIYLHSFTGTLDMFTRWQHRFVDILAGLSWLSLQGEEGETLARSVPFECLALESDAPHLSPLTRDMNSPWLLCHHAQFVAQARNLPATVVLERAALNMARFYGLEDDWDVHGWLGFVILIIWVRCNGRAHWLGYIRWPACCMSHWSLDAS